MSDSPTQTGTGLRELYECPAVMQVQPAAFDGEREARRILCRCAPIDVQERAVELLDADAPILHNLEGVRVLHQRAKIGQVNTGTGEREQAFSLQMAVDLRQTIFG